MNKQLNISIKDVWFAINGILLSISTISWAVGAENVFGVCGTLLLLLSFPSNLLVGWLFFTFGNLGALPSVMLLMIFAFSGISYLQWFVLVPRVVRFIRQKFFSRDLEIKFTANVESTKQIAEPNLENLTQDWQVNWYNEYKQTPVERVLNQDLN